MNYRLIEPFLSGNVQLSIRTVFLCLYGDLTKTTDKKLLKLMKMEKRRIEESVFQKETDNKSER